MCELMCVSASASAARTTSTLTYNASSVRLVNNREVNVEWTEREELSRKFCSADNFGPGPIFSEKIVPPGTNFPEKRGRC